ncbi:MAG TPA: YlxR family protein [Microbacteriaceae bacterium]|nr:YlxR family protein [Microbacteriaceae bacterium]
MVPARTCVGCRRRDTRAALLRLVARDGAIVPDEHAILPGRGAWVHRDRECVEAAVRRRAFGRAFRTGAGLDASALARLWIEPDPSDRTG